MSDEDVQDQTAIGTFIAKVRELGHEVEGDQIIARKNIYRVDRQINLLVRTSRFHDARHTSFFGLTRHIFQNFA